MRLNALDRSVSSSEDRGEDCRLIEGRKQLKCAGICCAALAAVAIHVMKAMRVIVAKITICADRGRQHAMFFWTRLKDRKLKGSGIYI